MAVEAALRLKGLDYERVALVPGKHPEVMAATYGEGNTTVPGLLVDGEPVHGSRAIYARLDELAPDAPLLPDAAIREAAAWGDEHLQPLGRRLTWCAMHFRPEALGTFGGAPPLDPPGTDFAIRYVRASWKYHGITAVRVAEDLAGLPAKLDRVDAFLAEGVLGGEQPNAADFEIGATLRVLHTVGDLHGLMDGRPGTALALRLFPDYPGLVPAGALPAGWVPARD
jgi:glutathione S-transferase